jgi:hypothetical protein
MRVTGEIDDNTAAGAKARDLFRCVCGTTEVVPCYKAGLHLHLSASCFAHSSFCSAQPFASFTTPVGAFPTQVSQAKTMKRGLYV